MARELRWPYVFVMGGLCPNPPEKTGTFGSGSMLAVAAPARKAAGGASTASAGGVTAAIAPAISPTAGTPRHRMRAIVARTGWRIRENSLLDAGGDREEPMT